MERFRLVMTGEASVRCGQHLCGRVECFDCAVSVVAARWGFQNVATIGSLVIESVTEETAPAAAMANPYGPNDARSEPAQMNAATSQQNTTAATTTVEAA